MNYFKDCQTLEDVKKLYRQLAKNNHPDRGGDVATMQVINLQYSNAIKLIAKGYKGNNGAAFTDSEAEAEILQAEAYREAIQAIINIEGINIELCGSYIWVTPLDAAKYWDFWPAMKAAKFLFAKVKKQYFFRTAENAVTNRKTLTAEQIRSKYGSTQISRTNYNYLVA